MKKNSATRAWFAWIGACIVFISVQPLHALPQGMSVQAGDVTMSTTGSAMQVQSGSNRAIVNWEAFSIMQGESAMFALPGVDAAILNRVTGTSISE